MHRLRVLLLSALALVFFGLVLLFFLAAPPAERVAKRPARANPIQVVDEIERPDAASTPPLPRAGLRALFGQVHSTGGEPISGASLKVTWSGGSRTVRTDAQGAYYVDRLPLQAHLEANAAGYEPYTQPLRFGVEVRTELNLALTPQAGIRGLVQVGQEAVPSAWITLERAGGGPPLTGALSDAGGRFAFDWPAEPPPFVVRARHGEHGVGMVELYEPGEVLLTLPGGGFVEGQVVDTAGDPVVTFSLTAGVLVHQSNAPAAQSFEDAQGRFRLGPLAPGTTQLFAAAEGYQPATVHRVEIVSGETTEGVRVVLQGSAVISGRVTDARTGRPIEGAQVTPAEWRAGELAESVSAITDAQGRYRLSTLPEHRTSLRVSAIGYRPLLSGGVQGTGGDQVSRDFSLMPSDEERPAPELTGIGAVLRPHPRGVSIGAVMPGGPAAQILSPGDVVLKVDELDARRAGMAKVAQAIRGEEGSEVVLWIAHGGVGEGERVVLTRSRVAVPGGR